MFWLSVILLFAIVHVESSNQALFSVPDVTNATFSETYYGVVSKRKEHMYVYTYVEEKNKTQAVRIHVTSSDADASYPILIVVRQQRTVTSFQLPLILEHIYNYSTVSHTLCPVEDKLKHLTDYNQTIYVDISSSVSFPHAFNFTMQAKMMSNFALTMNRPYSAMVTPSEPQFFEFHFPDHVDYVNIRVNSADDSCMTLSVQSIHCPVYDYVTNIEFTGTYQTMSTKGMISVQRSDYDESSVYVVLVMKATDIACKGAITLNPAQKNSSLYGNVKPAVPTQPARSKNVTITVLKSLSTYQYFLPVLGAAGVFLSFYIIAAFIIIYTHFCNPNLVAYVDNESVSGDDSAPIATGIHDERNYGSTHNTNLLATARRRSSESLSSLVGEPELPGTSIRPPVSSIQQQPPGSDDDSSSDTLSDDVDMLRDAGTDKNVYRTNLSLFVSDLSRKRGTLLYKKYKLYHWYLVIISIFYGLPVIQLVLTYQKVLHTTGNEDLCYYNFYCANSLFMFTAFNSVASNMGYVFLGILFLILSFRKMLIYRHAMAINKEYVQTHGVPQHFGLFYAMGVGLSMEGVMSACYHVCPNYSNFQFDTAFMYILACLCMLKIYQIRHPDINATAHAAYMAMSIIILIGVVGVLYGTFIFWIVFTVMYIALSIYLTAEVYYMGRWRLNRSLPKRIYLLLLVDKCHCIRPMYPDRMILLLFANIINWSIAIYGVITRPADFPSYMVGIFMINLFMYFVFYVVMKVRHRERLTWQMIIYTILATLCAASAVYYFTQYSTSWELTPSKSREINSNCILLDFYDVHDVWHFLSSIAMFFSFMILLVIDDDRVNTPRNQIRVF